MGASIFDLNNPDISPKTAELLLRLDDLTKRLETAVVLLEYNVETADEHPSKDK